MSATRDRQRIIRAYKEATGKDAVDMHEVVDWAVVRGLLELPKPKDPRDILVRRLSQAAAQQRRTDETGRPVKVWHSVKGELPGGQQTTLWYDIDDAPRPAMHKSAAQRRTGILNDAVQLSLDLEYWNRKNPEEDPIQLGFDMDDEIEWEKLARDAERDDDPPPAVH